MNGQRLLSTAEAANILGISAASVRNWVRHGYLKKNDGGFDRQEVETLLNKIRSGEIDRLNRRANKRETAGTLPPAAAYSAYTDICSRISSLDLQPAEIMLLTALALFKLHGLTAEKTIAQLTQLNPADFDSEAVLSHLRSQFTLTSADINALEFIKASQLFDELELPIKKPSELDIAGIIYQAVCRRGSRSATGSFYTPPQLSDSLIYSAVDKLQINTGEACFIDPCCGSGQFLLSFIKAGGSAEKAVGIDSDPAAAFIAGVNILLQCPALTQGPLVFTADSLLSELPAAAEDIAPFDLAVTNPPWGAATAAARDALTQRYPDVSSGESFSYFISRCLELVKPEGVVSLVLPESAANVNRHKDIRGHILKNSRVSRIEEQGRAFSNVYTPVITMELVKNAGGSNKKYITDYFYINLNSEDAAIIDSIYELPHTSLKGRADWALGIVTGNNSRFITDKQTEENEPIIRGRDIRPGRISRPESFIRFEPELFQQTAPEWKYRSPEKLVYKFISKRLIFAVDHSGMLSLNSANILIPDEQLIKSGWGAAELEDYLNSDICSFVFRKKFNSVKVLRSHLEALPLPTESFRLSSRQIEHIKNSF